MRKRMLGSTVEGRRAVLEALRAGVELECIFVAVESHLSSQLNEAIVLAKNANIPIKRLPRRQVDTYSTTKKAQGIVGVIPDRQYAKLEDLLSLTPPVLLCVLDGVQDPQNLGAIARTLEVVGGQGLIIRKQRAVGVTPGSIRASAGALEHLDVVRVSSIPQTLKSLRSQGVLTVGLDMSAAQCYNEIELKAPLAIIVGNEERGISKEALAECELTAFLPQKGKIGSLNVSVAASLMFYEFLRSTL